ncbi:MAG: hypothetical protein V3S24_00340, partial [Candidatus Tectomicrobia bacterium]
PTFGTLMLSILFILAAASRARGNFPPLLVEGFDFGNLVAGHILRWLTVLTTIAKLPRVARRAAVEYDQP